MNPAEYARLERIDQRHWFYRGKRAIVRYWLKQYIQIGVDDIFVDAGVGTGIWMESMAAQCRVIGLDDHRESLLLARPRSQQAAGLIQCRMDRLPLRNGCARIITALDVLEHVANDGVGLRELLRILHPQGILVLTVPAHPWLWSDWDLVLHHHRRYACNNLRDLIYDAGGKLIMLRSFNTLGLPALALTRAFRRIFPIREGKMRLENRLPPVWLNGFFYQLMVRPACWRRWAGIMGSSYLAIIQISGKSSTN